MRQIVCIISLIFGGMTYGFASDALIGKAVFATVKKANELLTQDDEFTKNWSAFDIDSRMHKPNSTKEELFDFITQQTRAWTKEEKNKMQLIFKSIDESIASQGFKIAFPKTIYFIKTTSKEEGGAAGYTRGNYIVLKDDILKKPIEDLKKITIHELFHVLTRNNPEFRKNMYAIIGFKLINSIAYPESLKNYRITNPDAPQTDSYINVNVNGESKNCMMILYATKDYTDGSFFKYLNIGFLSLVGDTHKTVEYKDNNPVIYTLKDVSNFFEQVGKNTQYIIHPEEILADNFSFTILNKTDLPNPEIVDKTKKILKK